MNKHKQYVTHIIILIISIYLVNQIKIQPNKISQATSKTLHSKQTCVEVGMTNTEETNRIFLLKHAGWYTCIN